MKNTVRLALRASLLAAAATVPVDLANAAPLTLLAAGAGQSQPNPIQPDPAQPDPTQDANDPVSGTESNPGPSTRDVGRSEGDTIVVTGTLIRNTAPTGTNPISVSTADIEATGATSASEVLASIPQITGSFFNNIPQVQAINATALPPANQTTARPSLRPNPFGGTDSGNATLLLLDGVRQAGIGVNGNAANPDSVPPALIQRVDVNPDGASSIYGSDAIGGVINFITRRKFDGILVGGSVGLRSNYTAWEGNVTAGKDWGSGGAYIGYSYSSNDLLLNREVSYYNPLDFSTGLQRDLSCERPNVQVNASSATGVATTHYYAVNANGTVVQSPFTVTPAGSLVGTPNVCTLGREGSLASANTRHHVLARFTQDLSDTITVGLRARYVNEKQYGLTGPSTFSVTVNNTNPFWQPLTANSGVAGVDPTLTSYTVRGTFGALQPEEKRRYQNTAEQYGIMADLSWEIGKWRMLALANFEWSNSSYSNPAVNGAAVTAASSAANSACSLNPNTTNCSNFYNIGTPSNASFVANALNFFNVGKGADQITNFRVVFDGPLVELPGGEVKVAIGAEYLRDKFRKGIYTGSTPSSLTQAEVVQTDKAVFGEINVPIFSSDNAIPLFQSLSLNAQGRYDHFSDFGGTFNPRFGASWEPVRGVTLRGNWGKTFRAPTTVDLLGQVKSNTSVSRVPANVFFGFLLRPEDAASVPASAQALTLAGTNPNIGPQRGENWSVGLDLTPISNFKASVTYYKIFFKDLLAQPFNGTPVFPNLAFLTDLCGGPASGPYNCSAQKIADFIAQAGQNNTGSFNIADVYGLYDSRVTNLGNARVSGLDWAVQYTYPTTWGSVFGSLSGAILLSSESQALPGQPYIDNLAPGNQAGTQSFGRSQHRISGRLGANYENARAQLTWNHNSGWRQPATATILQDHVGAFDVFNLFFSYQFKGDGLENDLKLMLNIDNVFNTSPPEYRTTNAENGYINGSTLGRLFRIGFEKKF